MIWAFLGGVIVGGILGVVGLAGLIVIHWRR
jgi:hypothetical protein